MISISHSPNSTWKQTLICIAFLLFPWNWHKWRKGRAVRKLRSEFVDRFKAVEAYAFSSAREALIAIFQSNEIGDGDEVIIQAYTCIVLPNAIHWVGAKPVFVDIDKSMNVSVADLKKKVTANTKAVVIQHAFGMPADISDIQTFCKEKNILLIEDCALSLGASYRTAPVGGFGDVSFFSFGRDKVISAVSGGLLITHEEDQAAKLQRHIQDLPDRSVSWIFQNLMHPIIVPFCTKLMGRLKVGQILLMLFQSLRLVNRVYTAKEKISTPPSNLMHNMPNAMATLALEQLEKLHSFNQHRVRIAEQYQDFCEANAIEYQKATKGASSIYLRFPILINNPQQIIREAKNKGILLGDWYSCVVVPCADPEVVGYRPGDAPLAEQYAERSINLPTHYKMKDRHLKKLLKVLGKHV